MARVPTSQHRGKTVRRFNGCAHRAYSLIPSRSNSQQAGQLRFEGISFRYSEHHPWLYKNLSLTIKPNKCTVIMGPSGCGKSTLTKLLLGFVQPQEGSIQLDCRDIRHVSANEIRQPSILIFDEAAGSLDAHTA
ncbi:MAG TPA: ATP-binding cassette domain-containing protein [Methylophilaceae bacterium]|nr:ATP-binding cassette domain-containing protein [Methylophilaceae bacterium]HQC28066.1 ATP-binding cassette domain-containing protein [Methylotenera sp.]